MNSRPLTLVNGCPEWCREDHAGEPPEDWGHATDTWELRLPDGRMVLDASVTLEPGEDLPRLVLGGPLGTFLDDVAALDADGARALEAALHAFTARVQRVHRTLLGKPSSTPAGKKPNPGQRARSGWHETRLYLAERDGRQCFYCRTPFDRLKGVTIDHYVPKSVWRCNLPANLVLACRACNEQKGDRLPWPLVWLLLAWAREGGAAGDGNGAPTAVQAPPARSSLASLAG